MIYYRIDSVLLETLTGTATVGVYGAAYRLFDTLVFVPNIVILAVMYPVMAKLSVNAAVCLTCSKAQTLLLQARMIIVSYDHMVEQLDIQQLPGFREQAGGSHILIRYMENVLSS